MIELKSYLKDNNLRLDFENVKPKYKCGICKDILCKPKTAKCCCSFCEICFTNHKKENKLEKCPSCSRDFEFGMDVSHDFNKEMKIYELDIKCARPYCEEEVKLKGMRDHLERCTKDGVRCALGQLGCSVVTETSIEMNNHVNGQLGQHLNLIVQRMDRDDDCRAEQNQIVQQKMQKIEEILEKLSRYMIDIKKEKSVITQKQTEMTTKQTDLMKKQSELAQKQMDTRKKQADNAEELSEVNQKQQFMMFHTIAKLRLIEESMEKTDRVLSVMKVKEGEMTQKLSEVVKKQTEMMQKQTEMIKKQGELSKKQNEMEQNQSKMTQNQTKLTQKQSEMTQNLNEITNIQTDIKQTETSIMTNHTDFTDGQSEIMKKLSDLIQKQSEIEKSQLETKQNLSEMIQKQTEMTEMHRKMADTSHEIANRPFKGNFKLNVEPIIQESTGPSVTMHAFLIKRIQEYNVNNYYFTEPFILDSYHFKIRMSFEVDNQYGDTLGFQVWLEPSVDDDKLQWPLKRALQLEVHKSDGIHKIIHTFSYDTAPAKSRHLYDKPSNTKYVKLCKISKYEVITANNDVKVALKMLD